MVERARSSATRWLVTGGTGAIGPAIVEAVKATGGRVRLLTRAHGPTTHPLVDEIVIGDVTAVGDVDEAVSDVDVVIHAAGARPGRRPTDDEAARMRSVNRDGTRRVAEAAARAGVERVIYISTAAVYGRGTDTIRTESDPASPDSAYGRTKLEAEDILLDVLGDRVSILRPCAVYGARLTAAYTALLRAIRSPFPIPLVEGRGHCLVTDTDLACFVVRAAMHPATGGRRFNVTDGRFYTMTDLVVAMREATGGRFCPTPLLPRSWGHAAQIGLGATGGAPTSRRRHLDHRIASMVQGANVDSSAIRQTIGPVECADLFAGWTSAVRP
ncbi:MAG: NAD-dependent epimerase/dehydratase family protein [Aquihabitans sp.]